MLKKVNQTVVHEALLQGPTKQQEAVGTFKHTLEEAKKDATMA